MKLSSYVTRITNSGTISDIRGSDHEILDADVIR